MLEPMSVAVHALRRVKVHRISTQCASQGTIGSCFYWNGMWIPLVIGNKAFQKEKILKLIKEQYCDIKWDIAKIDP